MTKHYRPSNEMGFLETAGFGLLALGIVALVALFASSSCGLPYTSDEIEGIKESAVEAYIEKNGSVDDLIDRGYEGGRFDTACEVLDLLDYYGIDNEDLRADIEEIKNRR